MAKVISISQTDTETWQRIWEQCNWAVYSESPSWSTAWQKAFPNTYEPAPLLITFSDDVRVLIPLTLGKRAAGWIHRFEAGPAGTSGGPLSVSALTSDHVNKSVQALRKTHANFFFRLNPYLSCYSSPECSGLKAIAAIEPPVSLTEDFTQAIKLTNGEEVLKRNLRKKQVLQDARKASKYNFQLHEFGPADLNAYYRIYLEAQDRWDQASTSWPLNLFDALMNAPGCTFYGVYTSEGELLGGGPFLHSKNIVSSWLSIMSTNSLKYRIYEYFYTYLIFKFKEKGYHWLDLNPSGGHQGVVTFKGKFLPEMLDCPVLTQESGILSLLNRVRTKLPI